MLRLLIGLICMGMLAALATSAEQTFPYKAYVTADDVEVRSGPGDDFYPTDKLKKGEMVEVYRRAAGGWCAIRPLQGSFSWIAGRAVKLGEDNLAEVTLDNVAAKVGSSLSDVRDVVQVRMRKGDVVEIIDPKDGSSNQLETWYKIAPPSGEFRWVLEKNLDAQKPDDAGDNASLGDATSQKKSSSDQPGGQSKDIQAELDRLDLELSMMVVEEPSVWSFDAMRIKAESLMEQTESAADRGKARLLLNKIARFEDIKQRYDSVTAMREQNSSSNRFLAGLQRTMDKAAATADPERQFDGVGQLQQVFSPKLGAPRYALVDETGNVRYYVTPAPGVNLQNYVGRQIGVTGTRGYMPEQRTPHITARHVSSLESRIK